MNIRTISLVFACAAQLIHGKLSKNYDNSTFLDKTNTNVKFSWKYDVKDDMLFIGLEVKATGWVGFGFAHRIFEMQNYDVVLGRVNKGRPSFSDRHTIGYREPWIDLQQDYNVTYSEEINGTTTFEFYRKRLSSDSKDLNITLGPMWVVYAYHSTADYPSPYKSKHDHQGFKQVVILPLDTVLPSNTISPPTPKTNSSVMISTTESSSATSPRSLSTKSSSDENISSAPTVKVIESISTISTPSSKTNSSVMISTTESSSATSPRSLSTKSSTEGNPVLRPTLEAIESKSAPSSSPAKLSFGFLIIVAWQMFII